MSARDLLHDMLAAGFELDVADGKLLVTPASMLTDELRAALRASKPEVLALLAAERDANHEGKVERSAIISADGVPYWAADDLAGLPVWTDAEIATFEKRVARSTWLGYTDAKGRAEMLLHRDRGADPRRLCVECAHAGPAWRCARREAFMLDQLQRCPMFKEKTL